MILRPFQSEGIGKCRALLAGGVKRIVFYAPTGCHEASQKIVMADGSIKLASEIMVGDVLIGDDGTNRRVIELHRGSQDMVRVVPVKGDPFVVNIDHILSLVHTETGDIVDISVREWLGKSNYFKHCHKLFRSGAVEFAHGKLSRDLPVHPWLLGALLGDGCIGYGIGISNPDLVVQSRVVELAMAHGVEPKITQGGTYVALTTQRGKINPLLNDIRDLGIWGKTAHHKYVPQEYKSASIESRLNLLAGLIDTDGHLSRKGFDWISASEILANDVVFIARSLGFAAYLTKCKKSCQNNHSGYYFRVSISGETSAIPTVKKIAGKRLQKKSVLRTGFSVEHIGVGEYFGWEVDGNSRYLMGDFTVTHNSGKSVIAQSLTESALGKGKRVAIIANRVQLVRQMADRFDAHGIHYGILQGGNTNNIHLPVVICSINTVEKRGLPDCDLIIIDEGHACAGSKMYRELIFQRNNVPVIALTATPFSKGMAKEHKELEGQPLFQELVIAETIRGLIAQDFLVDCEIYAPSEPDLSGVRLSKNAFGEYDYSDKSEEFAAAVDQPRLVGDIVSHWHRLAEGKPTICFATSIPHSKHIVEAFKSSGVSAEHIDCYMDEDDKESILRRFKAGEFTVLSNCALLAEGFDYPACEVMILARPTKSLIRYIQMVGRILRPFHGKDRGLLLDHSGSVRHLGFPTDDLPLELDDGRTVSQQKKEREEPKPKACSKCSYMKPPSVAKCPKCGFEAVRTPEEIACEDGDLVRMEKKPKLDKDNKQFLWSQCLGLSQLRGKTRDWAAGLYKHCTQVWPRGLMDIAANPTSELMGKERSRRIAYAKRMEKKSEGSARLDAMKALVQGGSHA